MELAAEVSRLFAVKQPPAEALRRAQGLVAGQIGAHSVAVALWDEETDGLQIVAAFGPFDEDTPAINEALRGKRSGSITVDAHFTGQAIFLVDCFADPSDERLTSWRPVLKASGTSSLAALPLVVHGQPLGTMTFAFPETRQFGAEDRQFLEVIASLIAFHVHMSLASQELVTERGFFERVLELAPTAIALFDTDLKVRLINQAWCELTGSGAPDVLGKHYYEVFPEAPRPPSKALAALELGSVVTAEATTLYPEGPDEHRRFDLTYCPISDATGATAGLLMVAQEVTERVQVLELQRRQLVALTAAENAKDQFLSVLSHELRTPINAITGFGSLLLEGVPVEPLPDQLPFLRKMLKGADQLVEVVDDLLDASRIAADRLKLYPIYFEFRHEVERAVERLTPAAEDKNLDLVLDIPDDLPPIVADDKRVAQILSNLLSNAIKFTPAGGRIVVRARSDGGHLLCEVQDTGLGVSPEKLPYLFERFTQADMTTTREFGGLGLGLALVKALVEAHGGQVGAESAPGAGSTFWFTLPVSGVAEIPALA